MAADDATGAGSEPSLAAGSFGGGKRRGGGKTTSASRVGARVNIEGVRSIVAQFDTLLNKLKAVRAELKAINAESGATLGGGVGGVGVGAPSSNLARFGSMIVGAGGGAWSTAKGVGGFLMAGGGIAGGQSMSILSNRFDRNMQQSTAISQANMLTSSMYGGLSYGQMERQYLSQLGKFAGTREQAGAAFQTALGFGMTSNNAMSYLNTVVAPMVQASGGTMSSAQAAQSGATFLDPYAMRRASQLGIGMGKVNGVVGNPKTVAMGYLKDFEKRNGTSLNEIDFANMRSPGSSTRYYFKRLYMLSDEAVDTIIEAGMQNLSFANKFKRDINFSSQQDLENMGFTQSRLGMKAIGFMSTVSNREANFFANQESNMVGRLSTEEFIQETLGKLETSFGDLIGVLYRFERVITGITTGLMLAGGMKGAAGLFGIGGRGGAGGAGNVPVPVGGVGMPNGPVTVPPAGGVRGAMARFAGSAGVRMAGGAVGAMGLTGGMSMASGGNAAGIAVSGASGGLLAASMGAGPWGIAAAGVAAGGLAAKGFFDAKHSGDRAKHAQEALALPETELLKAFHNYQDYGKIDPRTGQLVTGGNSPGPRQSAFFDVWQRRRGALIAAMLTDANEQGMFNSMNTADVALAARTITYFGGEDPSHSVANDKKFANRMGDVRKFITQMMKTKEGRDLYKRYFDPLRDPFELKPVTTEESNSLVMSKQEVIRGAFDTEETGDPSPGERYSGSSGDPTASAQATPKGPSWDRLDGRMKARLLRMFKDSGGRVRFGNGWRSEAEQRTMFLDRYVPHPNGEISWNGKNWKRVKGPPAAPPGRSMHEIGLAADLQGDLEWVKKNAAKYGLKHFAEVNGEPWHVQLVELPNSRAEYDGGSDTGAGGAEGGTAALGGGGGGASSITTMSGVGFSLANALSGGGFSTGGGWSGGAGAVAGGGALPTGGTLSMAEIAKVAHAAGFRGNDLVQMVAIAMRESGGRSNAFNGDHTTGDKSYGLWQINMLGAMGPARAKAFGISDYDQLYDPLTNAKAAFTLYQQSGNKLTPWGGYKGKSNTYGAEKWLDDALSTVKSLGLGGGGGDGTFAAGGGRGGGGGNVIMTVHNNITASGNLQYDASQLFDATMARVKEATEMQLRRGS